MSDQHPAEQMMSVVKLLHRFGLDPEDADEFVRLMGQPMSAEDDEFFVTEPGGLPENLPAQTQRPAMTAEERKAAEKKRRRELEKRKRR